MYDFVYFIFMQIFIVLRIDLDFWSMRYIKIYIIISGIREEEEGCGAGCQNGVTWGEME